LQAVAEKQEASVKLAHEALAIQRELDEARHRAQAQAAKAQSDAFQACCRASAATPVRAALSDTQVVFVTSSCNRDGS
jgi:hypothetical protein